ncbi:metallophosphatase domain-containing protein [Flavimarina sp. Hel_I_48]|uniref:metallophosphatase domain-containing protein n=1 Tax=Flavimarina sp. Hel_I_48 TaxID=1392488 RepID=UPI00068D4686|nr:metallophosphatase domain-containing protein [Flavimarina sp. Hel_I_48]
MKRLFYKGNQITLISDTHGGHRRLTIPPSNILVHCGDACNGGNLEELADFFSWFTELPVRHRVFIPGNHDLIFDLEPELVHNLVPGNIIVLENSGWLIEDIQFYSVAARPWLYQAPEMPIHPIDFLLTHGPPYSILDMGTGCKLLYEFVEKVKPTYHIFGHIHDRAGQEVLRDGVFFLNVGSQTYA